LHIKLPSDLLEIDEPKSKRQSLHGQDTERGGIMIGFRPACARSGGGACAPAPACGLGWAFFQARDFGEQWLFAINIV